MQLQHMKHILLYSQSRPLVVRRENAALTHEALTSIQPEEASRYYKIKALQLLKKERPSRYYKIKALVFSGGDSRRRKPSGPKAFIHDFIQLIVLIFTERTFFFLSIKPSESCDHCGCFTTTSLPKKGSLFLKCGSSSPTKENKLWRRCGPEGGRSDPGLIQTLRDDITATSSAKFKQRLKSQV